MGVILYVFARVCLRSNKMLFETDFFSTRLLAEKVLGKPPFQPWNKNLCCDSSYSRPVSADSNRRRSLSAEPI